MYVCTKKDIDGAQVCKVMFKMQLKQQSKLKTTRKQGVSTLCDLTSNLTQKLKGK